METTQTFSEVPDAIKVPKLTMSASPTRYYTDVSSDMQELSKIVGYKHIEDNLVPQKNAAPLRFYIGKVSALEKLSNNKSYGACSAQLIPASKKIRVLAYYDGAKLPVDTDAETDNGYFMHNKTEIIDAGPVGTWAKFINHSSDKPNCQIVYTRGKVAICTLPNVTIQKNDQLVYDYMYHPEYNQLKENKLFINYDDNIDSANDIYCNNDYSEYPRALPEKLCKLFSVKEDALFCLPTMISKLDENIQVSDDVTSEQVNLPLLLTDFKDNSNPVIVALDQQPGITALMIAAYLGDFGTCKKLVNRNLHAINQQQHHTGLSAMFYACMAEPNPNKENIILFLFNNSEHNNFIFQDALGLTPIHHCIDDEKTIQSLFQNPHNYDLLYNVYDLEADTKKLDIISYALHKNKYISFATLLNCYHKRGATYDLYFNNEKKCSALLRAIENESQFLILIEAASKLNNRHFNDSFVALLNQIKEKLYLDKLQISIENRKIIIAYINDDNSITIIFDAHLVAEKILQKERVLVHYDFDDENIDLADLDEESDLEDEAILQAECANRYSKSRSKYARFVPDTLLTQIPHNPLATVKSRFTAVNTDDGSVMMLKFTGSRPHNYSYQLNNFIKRHCADIADELPEDLFSSIKAESAISITNEAYAAIINFINLSDKKDIPNDLPDYSAYMTNKSRIILEAFKEGVYKNEPAMICQICEPSKKEFRNRLNRTAKTIAEIEKIELPKNIFRIGNEVEERYGYRP